MDIGYGDRENKQLTGIIEIVASKSLPRDPEKWPSVGETIKGEVFFYRENLKEIDLKLIEN